MGHEPTTDRRRGDDGNTFAEILVAIVLMGTAIIAVIGGIRGVISASKVNEQQARVEAVLTSASDRLRAADYVPCPDLDGDYGQLSAAAAAAGAVAVLGSAASPRAASTARAIVDGVGD